MKYIIEIEDTTYTEDTREIELYKATNFNSLVFDQNGLDKLEKFETTSMIDKSNFSEEQYRLDIENAHSCGYQEGYKKGIEDLSHAMQVYYHCNNGEQLEHFGTNILTRQYAIENPAELIVMAKAYEEKKKAEEDTIKVGDVIYSEMSDTKVVVTSISEWGDYDCICSDGATFTLNVDKAAEYWTKVGHIDEVSQLLDKLRGEVQE